MSSLIRVLVVDDHAVVRKALSSLLTSKYGIEVIGEAADGVEAVEKTRALKPDVILMDLVMPRKGGLEAIQEIHGMDPGAPILILTSFNDEDRIVAAVKAGAVGYVLKDTSPDELVHAIRGAYMGKLSLPTHMIHLVISEPPTKEEQRDG